MFRPLGDIAKVQNRFTVLSGSEVDLDASSYQNQGSQWQLGGIFSERRRARRLLLMTLNCQSPSAAAVFVLGGSQNGWTGMGQ